MVEITIDVKTVGVFRRHERADIEQIRRKIEDRAKNRDESQTRLNLEGEVKKMDEMDIYTEVTRAEAVDLEEEGFEIVCKTCGKVTSAHDRTIPASGHEMSSRCMCGHPKFSIVAVSSEKFKRVVLKSNAELWGRV